MKIRHTWKRDLLLLAIPLLFLTAFYLLPLAKIAQISVSQFRSADVGSAIPWRTVLSVFGFTIYQAVLSTVLTILIGLPAAYLFGRFSFKGKEVLRIASTLPFILPTVVVAAGFNALAGPRGWLNLFLMEMLNLPQPPLNIANTLAAILLAHVFYNTSIIIRVVGAALAQFDRRLEDAARTLGASGWQVFREITLPGLMPSLVSAVLLVFLFDFTSFGVILMLGGPRFSTLEVEIYIQTLQFLNLPLAGILSLIQLAFTMLVTFFLTKIGAGAFAVPVMPRLRGANLRVPRLPLEKAFIGLLVLALLVLLVSPVIGLVLRSLLIDTIGAADGLTQGPVFSLGYYHELFRNRRQSYFYVPPVQAIINSLRFALTSAGGAVFLGLLLAYGLKRLGMANRVIEMLMMLPLGTSAVTLGLGFFVFFFQGAFSSALYRLLIPVAHTLISLPFVLRIIQPVLRSIPEHFHWAASSLGASPLKIMSQVDLPVIWRSLLTAALYAFTISLGEFGATSFLSRPDVPTMPVAIFRYLSLPGSSNYGQAMAMAVIILLVCLAGMLALDRLQYPATGNGNK